MGTAVRPAKTSPGPWDAFADVDAFVDEVLAELTAWPSVTQKPSKMNHAEMLDHAEGWVMAAQRPSSTTAPTGIGWTR
jgi:hypothetical protein